MELQHNTQEKQWYLLFVLTVFLLWLVSFPAYSGTEFEEGFETGGTSWSIDNGVWEIGIPTSGPNSCYTGVDLHSNLTRDLH